MTKDDACVLIAQNDYKCPGDWTVDNLEKCFCQIHRCEYFSHEEGEECGVCNLWSYYYEQALLAQEDAGDFTNEQDLIRAHVDTVIRRLKAEKLRGLVSEKKAKK